MPALVRRVVLTLWFVTCAAPAAAHPVPFSYLDLSLGPRGIDGTIVAHAIDLAHDLDVLTPGLLLDPAFAEQQRSRIVQLLDGRLSVAVDGRRVPLEWHDLDVVVDRQAVRVAFRVPMTRPPGLVSLGASLFPYDPNHQTFVNFYEDGTVVRQAILGRERTALEHFPGTRQGTAAVIARFLPAGVHHIAIGPDHILFLIGLLLLGGTLRRLVGIVTAFTLGHSLTLSLAALDLVRPPASVIEPAIALSIVYVGADNLLVTREGRDVRPWIAATFGLIHGFGFAAVLREIGLPRAALGWSLFSFNIGVEIGQVVVVVLVAGLLAAVRRRSELAGRRIAVAGSVAVISAGTYWFIERVFFVGL